MDAQYLKKARFGSLHKQALSLSPNTDLQPKQIGPVLVNVGTLNSFPSWLTSAQVLCNRQQLDDTVLHKDEATKSYNVCSPPRYKISDSVFLKGIVLLLRIQLVQ